MPRKVFRRENALADFEGRPGTRCAANAESGTFRGVRTKIPCT